jgi:hypothetical protein
MEIRGIKPDAGLLVKFSFSRNKMHNQAKQE